MQECQICYEEFKADDTAPNFCVDDCKPTICRDCASQHFEMIVDGGFDGACPKMKCPACTRVVPKREWSPLVPQHTKELFERRARLLMSIQCGSCHTRRDVFLPSTSEESVARRQELLDVVGGRNRGEDDSPMRKVSESYESGMRPSEEEVAARLEEYERNEMNEMAFYDYLGTVLPVLAPSEAGMRGQESEEAAPQRRRARACGRAGVGRCPFLAAVETRPSFCIHARARARAAAARPLRAGTGGEFCSPLCQRRRRRALAPRRRDRRMPMGATMPPASAS